MIDRVQATTDSTAVPSAGTWPSSMLTTQLPPGSRRPQRVVHQRPGDRRGHRRGLRRQDRRLKGAGLPRPARFTVIYSPTGSACAALRPSSSPAWAAPEIPGLPRWPAEVRTSVRTHPGGRDRRVAPSWTTTSGAIRMLTTTAWTPRAPFAVFADRAADARKRMKHDVWRPWTSGSRSATRCRP